MAALWEIYSGSIGDSRERAESSRAGRPTRIFSPTVKFNAGLAKDRKEWKASATDPPQACQGQPSVRLHGGDELEVALWPLTGRGKPYLMWCPAIFRCREACCFKSLRFSACRHIVEIHSTLNRSCRQHEAFQLRRSAIIESAVHSSLNYVEFGSRNLELSVVASR